MKKLLVGVGVEVILLGTESGLDVMPEGVLEPIDVMELGAFDMKELGFEKISDLGTLGDKTLSILEGIELDTLDLVILDRVVLVMPELARDFSMKERAFDIADSAVDTLENTWDFWASRFEGTDLVSNGLVLSRC